MTSGIFLAESSNPSIPKLLLLGHVIIATIKATNAGSILLEAREPGTCTHSLYSLMSEVSLATDKVRDNPQ